MKIEPFKAADQAPALADAAGRSGDTLLETIHGGPDALGVPAHDFSTNANACGPCPDALDALRRADFARCTPIRATPRCAGSLRAFTAWRPSAS